jgi:NtrC-family two-component system response regulator AlgB
MVADGSFREDLYYRLNVIPVHVPPLRDRREDIMPLALDLLQRYNLELKKNFSGFTPAAAELMINYPWPGNIRELRNVIERAAILCAGDVIGREHLPQSISPPEPPIRLGDPVPLSLIEENHIRRVLAGAKSLQEAADILGIDQATLWRKRKQFGI